MKSGRIVSVCQQGCAVQTCARHDTDFAIMSVNHHDRLAEQVERDEVARIGNLVDACQREPALAQDLVGFARVHILVEIGGWGQGVRPANVFVILFLPEKNDTCVNFCRPLSFGVLLLGGRKTASHLGNGLARRDGAHAVG